MIRAGAAIFILLLAAGLDSSPWLRPLDMTLLDEIGANFFMLPATVQMKDGASYTWQVSARLPDGRTYSSSAEFTVAPAELRAEAKALRPAQSAPLSSRIAYAAWLDQMELKDEARKYWKTASAERPEDPRLRELAGQ